MRLPAILTRVIEGHHISATINGIRLIPQELGELRRYCNDAYSSESKLDARPPQRRRVAGRSSGLVYGFSWPTQ